MKRIEFVREGEWAHKGGHVWVLKIDGVYAGTYETRRQAMEAVREVSRSEES